MRFGAGYMAVWLWLVPAVILFYWITAKLREKLVRRFTDEKFLPVLATELSPKKQKVRTVLLVTAIFLLILALTRPQWGFQWEEVKRRGLDIIIALDTSKSMLAEDVLPSRLERSKLAIEDLLEKLHGDRIGLVAFSGTAFLQCPLTLDYNGFMLSLKDLDTGTIPVGGTAIASAIYTAIKSFEKGDKEEPKVLIVITDGEDLEGGMEKAIAAAKLNKIKIFCVGIGSKEGELIPLPDEFGKTNFLKDAEGKLVKTRLNEEPLQKMAVETGGMYVRATGAEFGLGLIYDEALSKIEKQELETRMQKRYFERFQIPLIFAIILLFLEPLIGDKKRYTL